MFWKSCTSAAIRAPAPRLLQLFRCYITKHLRKRIRSQFAECRALNPFVCSSCTLRRHPRHDTQKGRRLIEYFMCDFPYYPIMVYDKINFQDSIASNQRTTFKVNGGGFSTLSRGIPLKFANSPVNE